MKAPKPFAAERRCTVAVDARSLGETGKGVPRVLLETLRALAAVSSLRLILITNRPLHPANALPIETIVDIGWRWLPGSLWMLMRLNRLAKRAGADVLWGPAHVIPRRDPGLPTVLTVHDLVYRIMPQSMSGWNRLISRLLVDGSIRRADRVAAVSGSTRDDIAALVGVPPQQITVIYPGVFGRAMPELGGATERDNYLFLLGSIEPRKNIDGMLKCFDILVERDPTLGLRLTGAHSWGAGRTVEQLGKRASCVVLGFLSDLEVQRQLARARAFVMPSHYEGLGLPIIEAVGRAPIIAADIPVFRELASHIEGMHLVDFSNPAAAAECISNILKGPPEPTRFSSGAQDLFAWPTAARSYARLFRELCAQHAPAEDSGR